MVCLWSLLSYLSFACCDVLEAAAAKKAQEEAQKKIEEGTSKRLFRQFSVFCNLTYRDNC
jgi:hypothetical protein